MKVSDLQIDPRLKEKIQEMGIVELYPPQRQAVEAGLLEGKSLIVATQTASGKTLLALLAACRAAEQGLKTLYLSPLRALTAEKAEWFRKLLEPMGYKVAATSRDYDSPEEWLKRVDVIVATYEKADSLIRHRSTWLRDLGLIVIDELHNITDPERGPRLEIAVTALTHIAPNAQRLGLSATISNHEEFSKWLVAECIVSDWRPTPLAEAVYYDGKLYRADGQAEDIELNTRDPSVGLVLNTILDGGQAMV
ncbi:MAG: DEAD/DEAH box helicase, partial [Desulfurococcales archaeon]|nr:DEAD/DEAH box helicase [Desulfurococcales archaeon]